MKRLFYICLLLSALILTFLNPNVYSQQGTMAIRGGTFITVTQGIIENGTMIIRDGVIEEVGRDIRIPRGAKVIDAAGLTVMPGLIDCFTNLGTADIESFGTDDDEATDPVTPHLRVTDGLNPDNRFIPLARKAGITNVLSAPGEGNLLSGQSALIHLSGESPDDMVIAFPVGVHASLGEAPKMRYGKQSRAPMTRMGEAALLRQTLVDAGEYLYKTTRYNEKLEAYEKKVREGAEAGDKPAPVATDFKMKALLPVITKNKPLILGADRYDDILTALRVAGEFDVTLVLNHGAEAYRVADKLAEKGIPVIVGPSASYYQREETTRANPENAALLNKAGIRIAFQTGSVKNYAGLLHTARHAAAHGLPHDAALKALTLYPAQIFGVAENLGSLEKGKIANIAAFDGDPLDDVSRTQFVVIKGKVYDFR